MIQTLDVTLPQDITLACRATGAGAPRVLLLHGFPEAACAWDEIIEALAAEAACLAPNLRGYAGSSAPTELAAYRARALVGDVAGLIEKLGAPMDLVVAHDWGGALAWNLAAQRPELMRRLLIVNSPHPAALLRELRDSPAQQRASAYMNFLCRNDAEALLAEDDWRLLRSFFGAAPWFHGALEQGYRAAWSRGLSGPLNFYRASPLRPATGASDPLHGIELPDAAVTVQVRTQVLWGERDQALLPGLLDGLARWVPDLEIERVPDASHWIVHERPELVLRAIRKALAAVVSRG